MTVELLDPNVAKIYSKSKRAKVRGKGKRKLTDLCIASQCAKMFLCKNYCLKRRKCVCFFYSTFFYNKVFF